MYIRVCWLCLPSNCNNFWVFRHSKFLELCLCWGARVRTLPSKFSFELCRVPPSWRRVFPLQSPFDSVGGRDRQLWIHVFFPFCCGEQLFFYFSVVSRRAASLLISSTNSSCSRKLTALAGKSVSTLVRQVSSGSSMGMIASVRYVSRKGDSLVVEWGVVL